MTGALRRPGCALALLLAAGTAQSAPEDGLLAELSAEFREAQSRCESAAGRFAQVPLELSLYREELAALMVHVDGVLVAETANGALQRADLESRLFGPATATIVMNAQLAARDRLRAGRPVQISFRDRAGRLHPLFCGHAVLVREDTAAGRLELSAMMPRAGREQASSADFTNLSCIEIMQAVAAGAGLGFRNEATQPQPALPLVARRQEAAWTFLRRLARQCGLDVALPAGGPLLTSGRVVPVPAAPSRRSWTDMTWVDVAKQVASQAGRAIDARLTSSYPRQSFDQQQPDDDFLAAIAAGARASAWYSPGKLQLAEDGAWLPDPSVRYLADARMTPVDFARQVALRQQLTLNVAATSAARVVTIRQRGITDAEALLRVLGENALRLAAKDGALVIVPSSAPGDIADLLLQRVTVTGSSTIGRSFTRRYANVRAQLLDPERVPGVQVTLGLGSAFPQPRPPAQTLADPAVIARELEGALVRLGAADPTAEGRFLQDAARSHRPSLLHLYRLRPDGAQALGAIGR